MRVAVAGGTGVVGRHVVVSLRDAGHEPVVIARSVGIDLTTGDGLDAALDGVSVVIDVCSVATVSRRRSESFFDKTTTNLLVAGERAGVAHYAALSIVGCDRVGFGYYFGKRVQERLVVEGPLPYSILRATQFHEFPSQVIDNSPGGPLVVVPRMRSQPIAAREAAAALTDVALGEPAGMAGDLAGPEVHDMPDLVRLVLRSQGSRRAVVGMRLPGATGRALAGDGLLPDGPGPRGVQTFADWLGSRT